MLVVRRFFNLLWSFKILLWNDFLVNCINYPKKLMTCLTMTFLNKNRTLLCHNSSGCSGNIGSFSAWAGLPNFLRAGCAVDSSVPRSRVPGSRENYQMFSINELQLQVSFLTVHQPKSLFSLECLCFWWNVLVAFKRLFWLCLSPRLSLFPLSCPATLSFSVAH